MAREFSVIVGINAGPARRGAREFKAASDSVVRGSQRMSRNLRTANRRAVALITTIGRIRGVATLAFAGFLGVGGIGAVVKTLGDFEAGMKRVEALLGDRAVGGAMTSLTMKARELGAVTAFTATQAAEGMQFLTLAGFDALETFNAIGPSLELAQAGMLGLGESADIVSNIMQGFGINASRTQEVVDALAFVSTRSNTNIRQLGEAMKFVAPVAGAVGLSVQETSAALGLLGNSGLQASLAGTSLRRVISGLLGPSKEATGVLSDMNLRAEDLVDGLSDPNKGLVWVIEQLKDAGLGAAEAFTLFGQRGAPGVLSLINQTGDLREFNRQMENIEGTARDIGTVMIDNLQGDARIALSAVQEAIIRLGEAGLLEWLRESTQAFTAFVRGVADIDQELDGATEKVRKWAEAGVWMRENIELLRKALVVFTVYLVRNTLVAIGSSILAFGRFAMTVLALAKTFGVAGAAGVLMATKMKILRAAIVSTGVGAMVVAIGLILDWALFSEEAATASDEFTAAMDRQQSVVDDLAFKFNGLDMELKKAALSTTELTLAQQQSQMAGMTRAIQNQTKAQQRMNESTQRMIELQRIIDEGTQTVVSRYDSYEIMTREAREAQEQLRIEQEKYNEAQALFQSGAWASEEALEALRESVEKNELRVRAYRDVIAGLYNTVEEAIAAYNGFSNAQDEFRQQLQRETGLTIAQAESLQELIEQYDKTAISIAALESNLELIETAMNAVDRAANPERYAQLARVYDNARAELKKLREEMTPAEKAAQELADGAQEIIDRLDPMGKLTRTVEQETRLLIAAWVASGGTAFDLAEALRALRAEYDENVKALQESCKEARQTAECQSEAAKRIQSIWDQAMRNVQDAFADAFKGAFDSADEFFDRIIKAFKDMIAEMLAAWAASGIMNLLSGQAWTAGGNTLGTIFSAFGGGGGGGGMMSGGGGGGGIMNSAGQFVGALGKSIGAAIKGSAAYASLVGFGKAAMMGSKMFLSNGFGSLQIAQGSTAAGVGAAATGGAIGGVTGFVANKVFGGRGDPTRNAIFSTIGGVIGSIWGPIGSLIGGAIGSFVDNLIGGAKKLESATLEMSLAGGELVATTEQVVSTQRSFFRGRKFKTTTKDVSEEFAEIADLINNFLGTVEESIAALGGDISGLFDDFSFERVINTKGRSEEQIAEEVTNFIYDAMQKGIEMLRRADYGGVDEYIRLTLETFAKGIADGLSTNLDELGQQAEESMTGRGGGLFSRLIARVIEQQVAAREGALVSDAMQRDRIESFAAALQNLVAIASLLDADLVEITTEAIAEANRTAFESYEGALGAYRDLLAEYDGSLASLEQLTSATAILVDVQANLIAVYTQLGQEISSMFQDSAQTVREALMSEEELYNLRRSQIDELVALAAVETDPEKLKALADEINRLGLDAFNLLDETQQGELGQEFIDFFTELDELFGGQIQAGIDNITSEQDSIMAEVADRLTEVAQAQLDAARAAQDTFEDWQDWFERNPRGRPGGGGTRRERELIP